MARLAFNLHLFSTTTEQPLIPKATLHHLPTKPRLLRLQVSQLPSLVSSSRRSSFSCQKAAVPLSTSREHPANTFWPSFSAGLFIRVHPATIPQRHHIPRPHLIPTNRLSCRLSRTPKSPSRRSSPRFVTLSIRMCLRFPAVAAAEKAGVPSCCLYSEAWLPTTPDVVKAISGQETVCSSLWAVLKATARDGANSCHSI